MLASSKPIHCFSPLSRKLDVGWPRIEDFQLRGHSCVNNVQRCLCHFYTWMRHSKQTATLLLTKRHANFDTSTSVKGYVRVYELRMRNCSPWHTACSGSPHNALHSSSNLRCSFSTSAYSFLSCASQNSMSVPFEPHSRVCGRGWVFFEGWAVFCKTMVCPYYASKIQLPLLSSKLCQHTTHRRLN